MRGHSIILWAAIIAGAAYLAYMASGSRGECSFVDWITQKCGANGPLGSPS